jgi:hypothetical protein
MTKSLQCCPSTQARDDGSAAAYGLIGISKVLKFVLFRALIPALV